MRPQPGGKAFQLLIFLGLDLGSGDFGPQLNDSGQVIHGHRRQRLLFQFFNLGRKLAESAPDGCHALKVLVLRILVEHTQLKLVIVPLLAKLRQLGQLLAAQVHIGAGLIQQIDGFVRQEAVSDVPFGQNHALPGDFRRNGHAVIFGIGFGNPLQNLAGFLHGGLRNRNRLEPAL